MLSQNVHGEVSVRVFCLSVCAFLLASAVAFAGGTVLTVGGASFPNLSGSAANDLHVSLSSPVMELDEQNDVFLSIVPDDATFMNWTLSDGSVAPADSVDILWARMGHWGVPQLTSYYWTQDGTQVGDIYHPLYFDLTDSGSDLTLSLVNPTEAAVEYAGLSLSVDGTTSGETSGTLDPLSSLAFPPFQPVLMYAYTVGDLSTGAHLVGLAVNTVPEPATVVVVGAGLAAICALGRLRARGR